MLSPQLQWLWVAGSSTVHSPRGFCLCWQSPGLTTPSQGPHRRPLVLRQGVLGPWPKRAGRQTLAWKWGWDRVSARWRDSPGKSPVSAERVPGETVELGSWGQSRPRGSWRHKHNTHSLVAGGTGEVMGCVAPFLPLGKLRHHSRSYSQFATLGQEASLLPSSLPSFPFSFLPSFIQQSLNEHRLCTRFCWDWGGHNRTDRQGADVLGRRKRK